MEVVPYGRRHADDMGLKVIDFTELFQMAKAMDNHIRGDDTQTT